MAEKTLHDLVRIRLSSLIVSGSLITAIFASGARADPKREVPDYDGRGNTDARIDSWPRWIPRVVLSPLYAINEYLLRRPIGAAVTSIERDRWVDTVEGAVHLGGNRGGGDHGGSGKRRVIVPTALFDLGLSPTVGIYYARDDIFTTGNELRFGGVTWGPSYLDVTAADRYSIDNSDRLQVRSEFKRTHDNLFLGIGPNVTTDTRSRYGLERALGTLTYRRRLTNQVRFDVDLGVDRTSFVDGACCDDPSVDDRIAAGELVTPPGFGDTYTTASGGLELAVDTRGPRPEPGSGMYLRVFGRPSFDLHESRSWVHYGGLLGAAVDLTGHRRVLTMQLALDFVDSTTGGAIPFTEYPVLGERMPGFVTGWLTGRSAATTQLGYTWPIWSWLDGQARFAIGNAFGEHLDGLAPRNFRLSGDIGVTTDPVGDQGLEVVFGVGTETLEQGAGITSVRLTFGTRRRF